MDSDGSVPPGVDPTVPSPARLYDFYLGGKDNYAVDRAAAEKIRAVMPELGDAAWANRGFLQRAVYWLAAERGIRQFLDIGAGLPTQNNTHQVAQSVDPQARVVYVDNDPLVLVHARALLARTGQHSGPVRVVTEDLRRPDQVLNHPEVGATLDLSKPVALLLVAVVHFVGDDADPWALVARYMDALAPGSYLVLSHITGDRQPPRAVEAIKTVYENATANIHLRSRDEISRFFDGLELVPPYEGAAADVAYVGDWGAEDPQAADSDGSRWSYCGVARRP